MAGGEGQTEDKRDTRQADRKGQRCAETDVGCPDRREASELGMWPLQTAPVLGGDTGKRLRLEEMQNEHLKISADENAPPNTTRSRREQHNPAHSVNCPHRALL